MRCAHPITKVDRITISHQVATYLALFRGINIGGHNRVSMKDLTTLFERLDCENVRTYIQSGNVIFDTKRRNRSKLSDDLNHAVELKFGFSPTVVLLSRDELEEVIARNPFPTDVGKNLHILFLAENGVNADLEKLSRLKGKTESFTLSDKVFYLYAPEGVGRSQLAKNAERCLGVATTGRNWNTVSRLAAMMNLT